MPFLSVHRVVSIYCRYHYSRPSSENVAALETNTVCKHVLVLLLTLVLAPPTTPLLANAKPLPAQRREERLRDKKGGAGPPAATVKISNFVEKPAETQASNRLASSLVRPSNS